MSHQGADQERVLTGQDFNDKGYELMFSYGIIPKAGVEYYCDVLIEIGNKLNDLEARLKVIEEKLKYSIYILENKSTMITGDALT